ACDVTGLNRACRLVGKRVVDGGGLQGCGVEPPGDPWAVALQSRKDLQAHSNSSESGVSVRRIFVGSDASRMEEIDDFAPAHSNERAHEVATAARHPAKAGDPAATHQMQHDALDHIVSGVA